MKPALAFLLAALAFPISCAKDIKKQDEQQNVAAYVAASDAALPAAKLPVLKIGGKESAAVYLQSLDIEVETIGNIASTRYTMVFKNRTNSVLEGELTFPLPDGRAVTHYALDINGKMREAVPVEKARATEVFEEIEQRQVDPGLLERVEGNNFRTRIYPILANGTRTISIGYEEELPLERGLLYYRLPMAYPNSLEKFSVKATAWQSSQKPLVPEDESEIRFDHAGESYVASFARENYQPSRALIFALPAPADIPQVMMQPAQGSYYFLASVAPKMETRKKQWGNDLAIIWDVSLSGSQRDLQREMEMLDIIFSEKKNANVNLYFLSNKNVSKGTYKVAGGNWSDLKSALETAVFDGGTDFSKIGLNAIAGDEILFFSDGISTLSDADFLKNAKTSRPVHCFVSSAKADYSAMKLIAGKTKGKFVNASALPAEKLRDELLNETLQFLGVEHGNNVREAYPSIAAPVHGNFSLAGISDANDAELTLLFGFGNKVEKRIKVKLDAKNAGGQGNAHKIWAQKKIAELDLEYEKNRAELTELGQQFGIVTRNTSLIVLETLGDYIHYGIEPPAEMQDEFYKEYSQKERKKQQSNTERNILDDAVAAVKKLKGWYHTHFTPIVPKKPKYPVPDNTGRTELGASSSSSGGMNLDYVDVAGWMDNPSAVFVLDQSSSYRQPEISQPKITIKPIKKDNDYLNKLTGKIAEDYQIYLNLRNDYASSPAFYFDMADWFYKLGDKETALRILTSIAELELENASLYRLLGYRFKEYGEYALEKFACQKVVQWRPMEPQSYRDYALALADNGEAQAALDSLYSLLVKPYSENIIRRSRGIEDAVVAEINHLIAKNPKLNVSKIDKRLIMDIPVDIRVVINWNMNNTDIDLHVINPYNEECSYKRNSTSDGGIISADIRDGYGPEQYMLKKAVNGKYRVYVNYYGDRQFTANGPSTIMAEIFTKYAGSAEQRQVVTLQMSNANKKIDGKVEVAEFEF